MGVTGLWDVLRPAAVSRSFTAVAVDGFVHDGGGAQRAFRVGIDASIWFVHSTYGKEGENPELRTIFFRLTRLLKLPFLPLFVFDGPMRPDIKRGKLIDKKPHTLIESMKRILEAFGFEWRIAPGEAEAELAYLNRIGVIDAVLSDDVDTLVFGAHMVIRNPSDTLSGNRAHTQATKNHTMTFSAANVKTHPEVSLSYKDLILIALFSGGDYHDGVPGCGIAVAVGLARAGFAEQLITKVESLALSVQHVEGKRTKVSLGGKEKRDLDEFLQVWRAEVAEELRTNSKKLLGKRSPKAASNLLNMGSSFPNVDVLMAYVNPVTSEERAVAKAVKAHSAASGIPLSSVIRQTKMEIARKLQGSIIWPRDPSVGAIAKVCEDYFEWGYKEWMIQRFSNWLWEGIVCRTLRRKTIIKDHGSSQNTPTTSAAHHLQHLALSGSQSSAQPGAVGNGEEVYEENGRPLILKITSTRTHATTDGMLEYRLEIDPRLLVKAAENGIAGTRSKPTTGWTDDEDGDDEADDGAGKKSARAAFDPDAPCRYWMPACMVREGEPELAKAFEEEKALKELRKAAKGHGKGRGKAAAAGCSGGSRAKKGARQTYTSDEEDALPVPAVSSPPATPRKKKTVPAGRENTASQVQATVAAPSRGMPGFFHASKSTVPLELRAEKDISGSSLPDKPAVDNATRKGKTKQPIASSTNRVAALFNDPPATVFKDLTRPKASQAKVKPSASTATHADPAHWGPLHVPLQRIQSPYSALMREEAQHDHPMGSPTKSIPEHFMDRDASEQERAVPQAGPSKPSAYLSNTARTSTWKPAPFPLEDFLDEDEPLGYASSSSSSPEDPPNPMRRRERRPSSPRRGDTAPRQDELQKSPRKSRKQSSPRSSSMSPTRRSHEDAEPFEMDAGPSKRGTRTAVRRAVLKKPPAARKAPSTVIVISSSDDDSRPPPQPALRTQQKDIRSMLPSRKNIPSSSKPKLPPPLPPPDAEIIDLCSD